MEITVLCKVVDNFGDIGVAWRIVKQLKNENPEIEINLVVDDLLSFSKIESAVEDSVSFQCLKNIQVYKWGDFEFCYESFKKNDGEKLSIILELFQCGRPDWMEKILFEDKLVRTVQIIMIDYLTAEKYADDFHCLESLTRSKKVRKVNFMPGFTKKTGGLVIDDAWKELCAYNSEGDILIFTYERNWENLIKAVEENTECKVLIAQGRGRQSVLDAVIKNKNVKYEELEFLNQDEWDKTMQNSSVLFIRGEESMSRACLSGIPFVWQAYPQSEEYQMVKVEALLERMREYFSPGDFEIVKNAWISINQAPEQVKESYFFETMSLFLKNRLNLLDGYRKFAQDLLKNGDLCANLMTFIKKICIIE